MRPLKQIATVFSFAFHPLLLPTYLFALLGWLHPVALLPVQQQGITAVLLLVFITTFVLPALNVYFFKATGAIQSLHMITRKERIIPFFIIAVLYALVTSLLHYKTGISWSDPIMKFLLVCNGLVVSAFIITLFAKASIHSLGMGSLVVILMWLNGSTESGLFVYPLLISSLVAGVVMSSRLLLQAHTLKEVGVGFMAGMVASVLMLVILF